MTATLVASCIGFLPNGRRPSSKSKQQDVWSLKMGVRSRFAGSLAVCSVFLFFVGKNLLSSITTQVFHIFSGELSESQRWIMPSSQDIDPTTSKSGWLSGANNLASLRPSGNLTAVWVNVKLNSTPNSRTTVGQPLFHGWNHACHLQRQLRRTVG